jgi:hypothetical protein
LAQEYMLIARQQISDLKWILGIFSDGLE